MQNPTPQDLQNALNDGSIESANSETLKKYLILLSQNSGPWAAKQEYIVIGNTINQILLQRHIDGLNKQNTRTQILVIALTIASLIGTGVQVWYAAKADKTSEEKVQAIAAPPPPQEKKSAAPFQVLSPTSGQPTKKTP